MTRDLCIMACVFCRDFQFQVWVKLQKDVLKLQCLGGAKQVTDEQIAKEFILMLCCIESRNDLDTNPAAAQRFHELVRKPFLAWKERQ